MLANVFPCIENLFAVETPKMETKRKLIVVNWFVGKFIEIAII